MKSIQFLSLCESFFSDGEVGTTLLCSMRWVTQIDAQQFSLSIFLQTTVFRAHFDFLQKKSTIFHFDSPSGLFEQS